MIRAYSRECTEYLELIQGHSELSHLEYSRIESLVEFYRAVLVENEVQNLTRLLSPVDFFEGHLLDAWELEKTGYIGAGQCLDLGSGGGSPGLFHAIITGQSWVLCDSEVQKVAFLNRMIDSLRLSSVSAVNTRAEDYLASHEVGSIACKAVGTVEKIMSWIGRCSTWNKLVLFKGPRWDEEWELFQKSKYRTKLRIEAIHEYEIGAEAKRRRIILLTRP